MYRPNILYCEAKEMHMYNVFLFFPTHIYLYGPWEDIVYISWSFDDSGQNFLFAFTRRQVLWFLWYWQIRTRKTWIRLTFKKIVDIFYRTVQDLNLTYSGVRISIGVHILPVASYWSLVSREYISIINIKYMVYHGIWTIAFYVNPI